MFRFLFRTNVVFGILFSVCFRITDVCHLQYLRPSPCVGIVVVTLVVGSVVTILVFSAVMVVVVTVVMFGCVSIVVWGRGVSRRCCR